MNAYLDLLRPRQWIKNVLLFAALVFGRKLTDAPAVASACLGFALFCLLSSSVYVINDILDRQEDRLHPTKKDRPIAAGKVRPAQAMIYAVVLMAAALVGSVLLNPMFCLIAATFILLQAAYSLALKKQVIIDVICIASGFVLRAVAGAVLVQVVISPWLIVCTFTLCLFLGFGKRRCEIAMLAETGNAADHRPALAFYTPDLLNHLITVSAGIAIMSFLLYTTDPQTTRKFGTNYLIYTIPLVIYGIFRYAMLAERGQASGPTEMFLSDRPSQFTVIVWTVAAVVVIYYGPAIEQFCRTLER